MTMKVKEKVEPASKYVLCLDLDQELTFVHHTASTDIPIGWHLQNIESLFSFTRLDMQCSSEPGEKQRTGELSAVLY
ncbi:uncharacterized protein MEPE_05389 [Melanopsichium pennsylvanicum]|uniref:Uncharacterized protein n=1 Tax=Melanopsichium pennsylvanicum TaxID=63383 RepID=A0AAJ4XQJ8_9BASI|nr:uncharacterized protein MEPE_05389 [Melanopsichium pennsylvanicum]